MMSTTVFIMKMLKLTVSHVSLELYTLSTKLYSSVRCVTIIVFILSGDCENWEVRLVGSNGETEDSVLRGRVEICWNEIWRTVCDRGWSVSDATVVCRELGFSQFGK